MRRPGWVSEAAWPRLEAAVSGQPAHAQDVLDDLTAFTSTWDEPTRDRLLERFVLHAERGVALPAASVLSLSDLLAVDD